VNWHEVNKRFAKWMIEELIKDRPFTMTLNAGDTGSLHAIAKDMGREKLAEKLDGRLKSGTGVILEIDDACADSYYHMLSSYLLKKGG
jgi:hypothetical protein